MSEVWWLKKVFVERDRRNILPAVLIVSSIIHAATQIAFSAMPQYNAAYPILQFIRDASGLLFPFSLYDFPQDWFHQMGFGNVVTAVLAGVVIVTITYPVASLVRRITPVDSRFFIVVPCCVAALFALSIAGAWIGVKMAFGW